MKISRQEPKAVRAADTDIRFTSILEPAYQEDLEKLLFFNPLQTRAHAGISESIREYGVPNVVTNGERLRIQLDGLPETQSLFALNHRPKKPELVGVMVYARVDIEHIVLLHIAVKEEYSRLGKYGEAMLVPRLLTQLREIGRRIKGVRAINLKYQSGLILPL